MENDVKTVLTDSIDEIIRYFNVLHSEHSSELQTIKSKMFEIKVKLDELTRTQSLYTLNADYRKNVFSPIVIENSENAKEREIRNNIENLTRSKEDLENQLFDEETVIKSIEKKISKLNAAKTASAKLASTVEALEEDKAKLEMTLHSKEEAEKKIILKEREREKNNLNIQKHGKNILMLDVFDKTFSSTVLDKRVRQELIEETKKLEKVKNIVRNDPKRTKIVIEEAIKSNTSMVNTLTDQLSRMNYSFDDTRTLKNMIDDFIMDARDKHPELVIDFDYSDLGTNIDYIKMLSIYKLLGIFFDNIYKHSKASHVVLRLSGKDSRLEIYLNDNGIGLPEDFEEKCLWYGGISRARETVFLLDGTIDIESENGTTVIISFSIK